ncbi:hypothetical protein J0H58_33975, partial [bacterium]|nr:hypothetical protein [bacterium]
PTPKAAKDARGAGGVHPPPVRIARLTPRSRGKRELRNEEATAISHFNHLSGTGLGTLPHQARYERGFLSLPLWVRGASVGHTPQVEALQRDG